MQYLNNQKSKINNIKIKTLLFMLAITFCFSQQVSAQDEFRKEYSISTHSKEMLMYLEADYKSKKTEDVNQFVFRQLKIFDRSGEREKQKISKTLTNEFGGKGTYVFSEVYDSFSKSFIVILGDFCFYIYDMKELKLSPVLKPKIWTPLPDSLKGNIIDIKIDDSGSYIYGATSGGGAFMYSVCTPSKPKELLSSNPPFFSESRFFEVNTCSKSDLVSGVMLSILENEIDREVFFTDYKLKPSKPSSYANLTGSEIDNAIMEYSQEEAQFIVIEQTDGKFMAIDSWAGEIAELDKMTTEKNRVNILEFLREQSLIQVIEQNEETE